MALFRILVLHDPSPDVSLPQVEADFVPDDIPRNSHGCFTDGIAIRGTLIPRSRAPGVLQSGVRGSHVTTESYQNSAATPVDDNLGNRLLALLGRQDLRTSYHNSENFKGNLLSALGLHEAHDPATRPRHECGRISRGTQTSSCWASRNGVSSTKAGHSESRPAVTDSGLSLDRPPCHTYKNPRHDQNSGAFLKRAPHPSHKSPRSFQDSALGSEESDENESDNSDHAKESQTSVVSGNFTQLFSQTPGTLSTPTAGLTYTVRDGVALNERAVGAEDHIPGGVQLAPDYLELDDSKGGIRLADVHRSDDEAGVEDDHDVGGISIAVGHDEERVLFTDDDIGGVSLAVEDDLPADDEVGGISLVVDYELSAEGHSGDIDLSSEYELSAVEDGGGIDLRADDELGGINLSEDAEIDGIHLQGEYDPSAGDDRVNKDLIEAEYHLNQPSAGDYGILPRDIPRPFTLRAALEHQHHLAIRGNPAECMNGEHYPTIFRDAKQAGEPMPELLYNEERVYNPYWREEANRRANIQSPKTPAKAWLTAAEADQFAHAYAPVEPEAEEGGIASVLVRNGPRLSPLEPGVMDSAVRIIEAGGSVEGKQSPPTNPIQLALSRDTAAVRAARPSHGLGHMDNFGKVEPRQCCKDDVFGNPTRNLAPMLRQMEPDQFLRVRQQEDVTAPAYGRMTFRRDNLYGGMIDVPHGRRERGKPGCTDHKFPNYPQRFPARVRGDLPDSVFEYNGDSDDGASDAGSDASRWGEYHAHENLFVTNEPARLNLLDDNPLPTTSRASPFSSAPVRHVGKHQDIEEWLEKPEDWDDPDVFF